MKIIRLISRILVGMVFTFSGFVKAIDPLGSAYKFSDYFEAFGMEWAESFAFVLAFVLIAAEFAIGVMLIFGVRKNIAATGALLFMIGFTPLTFILALNNPVTDCGCFGDALVLSNWQTFWKNIIILIPTIIFFAGRKKDPVKMRQSAEWMFVGVVVMTIIGFSYYNVNHLPIIDFRPYKIGASIPDGMVVPEDKLENVDVYETTLFYKNTESGERKEFALENIPTDNVWEWDTTINKLVHQGYHPPIHDFTIESDAEGEITDIVLADKNYSFLLVAYNLEKTNFQGFLNAYDIADFCKNKGLGFYCLTSSLEEDINKLKTEIIEAKGIDLNATAGEPVFEKVYVYELDGTYFEFNEDEQPDESEGYTFIGEDNIEVDAPPVDNGFALNFYSSDEITLKTIIRSNPGLVLLKEGVIINKWHANDLPSVEDLEKEYFNQ